jgi:hypothetical protein
MARVIISYQNTQSVLKSDLYQHAQETVWLWNQGKRDGIQAISSTFAPKRRIIARRATLRSLPIPGAGQRTGVTVKVQPIITPLSSCSS